MTYYVVWIDKQHAKIFALTEQGITQKHLEAHDDEHAFLRKLSHELTGVSELLLVGPGVARTHLKHQLERENKDLARRIVGCEPMDHPTDREVVAYARRYFTENHDFWKVANA